MENNKEIKKAIFNNFSKEDNEKTIHNERANNFDILRELDVDLTIEFASKKVKFGDILDLKIGEVIFLNKQVNEPLKILINGKEIAKGEVVVMDDEFGIRITEIKK